MTFWKFYDETTSALSTHPANRKTMHTDAAFSLVYATYP